MNLLEYRRKYEKDGRDPIREMRKESSENVRKSWYYQDRIGEDRIAQDRIGKESRKELLAAAGLTDVQLKTLELIMLPDGLIEGLREVGTEGDVYRKLMDWWKEKVERQKMETD